MTNGCVQEQRDLLRSLAAGSFFKTEVRRLLARPYWESYQLSTAYSALIAHLSGFARRTPIPKQLPNGAAFADISGNIPSENLPKLTASAELGLVWAALGLLQKDRTLVEASLKLASWQMHTLDHRGAPYHFLWSRGSEENLAELLAWNEKLFSLAEKISGQELFGRASYVQKKLLQGWEISDYPAFLSSLAEHKIGSQERFPLTPFAEEATVGMAKFHDRSCSAAFALSGYNSGMGAFQKSEVGVVNFGPQKEPLDDPDGFGIARLCSLREKSFSDCLWEKQPHGALLKGWTKAHFASLWMEATMAYLGGQFKIKVEFQDDRPRDGLWWVFYVRAQKAVVSKGGTVSSYALKGYEGPAAKAVFYGEEESIAIEPHFEGAEMRLIPLAGGQYFWGAEFLLAYKAPQQILKFSLC